VILFTGWAEELNEKYLCDELAWIPTAIIGLRICAAGPGAETLVDYFIP
jgi:hypothetical protein